MPAEITEKSVRDLLLHHIYSGSTIRAHNLVGIGPYPHEMDVFRITRSGYGEEYEIKISAGDIKAEAKKQRKYLDLAEGCQIVLRYSWDAADKPIPSDAVSKPWAATNNRWDRTYIRVQVPIRRFYIAVPTEDLVKVAESFAPAWAGLLVARDHYVSEYRKPSILPHSRKLTPEEVNHVIYRLACRYYQQYFGQECGAGRK